MRPISLIACLITLAAAVPSQRRDDLLCFYMTSDPEWRGEGINLCQQPGICSAKLPDGLSKKVSSAGPDRGILCWLYSDYNCEGDVSQQIRFPGYADLATIGFNDRAQSWKCDYSPWA